MNITFGLARRNMISEGTMKTTILKKIRPSIFFLVAIFSCNNDQIMSISVVCDSTNIAVGQSVYCDVHGTRKDGNPETGLGKSSTFTVDDLLTLSNNGNGWFTGISSGIAKLTADYQGMTASTNITVN